MNRNRHGEVVFERYVGSLNWLRRTPRPFADEEEGDPVDELMPLVASLPNLLEAVRTTAGRLRRDSLLLRLQRHIDRWRSDYQRGYRRPARRRGSAEAVGFGPHWGGPG